MESQDIKIFTKKLSAGQYKVTVSKDYEDIGDFTTTDMTLIDEIQQMQDYYGGTGFEEKLSWFESFNQLKEHCLYRIIKTK